MSFFTQILQLKVSTLTVCQLTIFFQSNLLTQSIVVRTIVGDIQFTITTHHRQVTTTVETTRMLGTNRDEVVMIDIIERRCGIAEYGDRVGIALTVRRHVTTGKHSIADMHTAFFHIVS